MLKHKDDILKKIEAIVTTRWFVVGVLLIIQIAVLASMLFSISKVVHVAYNLLVAISIVCTVVIANNDTRPEYKIPWIILVLTLPVLGGAFYLMFANNKVPKQLQGKVSDVYKYTNKYLQEGEEAVEERVDLEGRCTKQIRYIQNSSYYPAYINTKTRYFGTGEQMYREMIYRLKGAEHFIFLEFFIINAADTMWQEILEILQQKAAAGVDVRLLYDDFGCMTTTPANFESLLREKGIKAYAFNPVKPRLHMQMNNRDHRKILVIDGYIGFTGGINLADEYINKKVRFGHWKDTGIMLLGDAVWSLSVTFLQMWQFHSGRVENYNDFSPRRSGHEFVTDGLVQPYADSPTDNEEVGQSVYLNVINNAERYVYITTPYLVIDNQMRGALCLAAKNGIDVRIITPHIPDKWYVHMVTRSNYAALLKSGVKIYEYTPGFIHAKSFVCDDKIAVIGTTNLDFRSLFLHFECGVWMYGSDAVRQIYNDYLATLEKSKKITLSMCESQNIFYRVLSAVLKMFAPLM